LEKTTNLPLFLIGLAVALIFLSSCEDKRLSSISDLDWRAAVLKLAYQEYGIREGLRISDLRVPRRIDWFKSDQSRFAAIYSARGGASLEYQRWFGNNGGGEIYIIFLSGMRGHLPRDSQSYQWYLNALDSDSLVLLFTGESFWRSSRSWESFYDSHKKTKLSKSYYELGMYYMLNYMASPSLRVSNLSENKIFDSDIGLAFALAFDSSFEQYVSDQRTITMLDYSVMAGDKFAAVVCRRDEKRGAYVIIIGRLDGHLMTFRLIGSSIHPMAGAELENYIDLLVNDKIWSLIGAEGFWDSEESLTNIYESCLTDSLTPEEQTRTLHMDSLFEPGYLERSVR